MVVTVPAGDGDEGDVVDLVADLLEVARDLRLDLVVALLLVVSTLGVHLVAAADHLLDTHGEGEQSVFTGLALLGPTGFELTRWRGDHEDGDISLRSASDHVMMKSLWPGASMMV